MKTKNYLAHTVQSAILATFLVASTLAQERAIMSPNTSSLSLEDLSSRSDAAEARLRELSAIVEAAIACQEQSKKYVPADSGSGSCADIGPARIYCVCPAAHESRGRESYDGYGNNTGSGGGDFNNSGGGRDHDVSTPD